MISYNDNLNKRTTFNTIFKQAEECGIISSIDDCPANQVLHSLSNKYFDNVIRDKISFITINIDFLEMCKKIKSQNINEYIEDNLFCSYWFKALLDKEEMFIEDDIGEKIKEDCRNKKIIFMNINANNYCLDREEEQHYAAHAVCAILIPSECIKNKKIPAYNLFYVNPHGEVMIPYTYFEEYISRKRSKKIDFGKYTVDYMVMKSICNYCNEKMGTDIYYDDSIIHNYYGVNLQEEDTHGICFIFPSVIYYYLGKYYTKKRELVFKDIEKIIPSFEKMLNTGKFNLAIHSCFIDFNQNYKKIIYNNLDSDKKHQEVVEELIKCLAKSKWAFVKNVTSTMVSFIYKIYEQEY